MKILGNIVVIVLIAAGSVRGETATNAASLEMTFSFTNIFPNSEVAVQNGSNIVKYIESGKLDEARKLIGKDVALYGGVAPPGGNADLVLAGGILLKIEIYPSRDVRPHAVAWSACVLGNVTGVDVQKKVIRIKARPENWQAIDTM
jgi:hypothetical protein